MRDKVRFYIFVIIHALICICVFGYVKELIDTTQVIEPVSNMNIDGSDFTGLANLLVGGFNAGFSLFLLIVDVFLMLFISLVLLLPFRFIAIRKDTMPLKGEQKGFLYVIGGSAGLLLLFGLIFMGIASIIPMVILFVVPAGLEFLLFWKFLKRGKDYEK